MPASCSVPPTVRNNIVFDNRYGMSEQGATGKHNSYRNNLVFGNRGADWRLAADSPAIGKGLEHGADGPDFCGKLRGPADAVDIDACQH